MVSLHRNPRIRNIGNYSLNLIAAMTQSRVVGLQVIEGPMDGTIFANFILETVNAVK